MKLIAVIWKGLFSRLSKLLQPRKETAIVRTCQFCFCQEVLFARVKRAVHASLAACLRRALSSALMASLGVHVRKRRSSVTSSQSRSSRGSDAQATYHAMCKQCSPETDDISVKVDGSLCCLVAALLVKESQVR